jgi:L-fuculose-phosphate aldolase
MSRRQEAKRQVLDTARKMEAKGLVVGTSGNVSVRIPDGKRQLLAITPTSRHYDTIGFNDIPIIDFEGKQVEGRLAPSVETPLHTGIYKARENVNAIIHTHSVYASAVSITGKNIPCILEDQVAFLGGEIKLSAYALSGTPALVNSVIDSLGGRSAVLLPNHGAIGTGRNMREAFTACELIEKTARIYLLALAAGAVNEVPPEALAHYMAYYSTHQNLNK